ncbi:enoyl-CoA hydratase/isomerase family protein [Chloroflexota bacterium]
MDYKNINLENRGGITSLVINRPPVNVIDFATLLEINAALAELAADAATKVLLIRGSGEKAFCAGIEVQDHVGEMMPKMMREFGKMFGLLRALGKPSIAVVNGIALGGGCELVAGCDLAVAAEHAKLGQPEIQLGGLAPAAAALFPRMMPRKKGFELVLLGDSISAAEAARIGLVNKVVPAAEIDTAAGEMAAKYLKMSGLAVRLCREAFYQCADTADPAAALDKATELGIGTWETHDGQEGLKAFLEKRKPDWQEK